ncbi:hypothetical protein D3C71_1086810 [compost metagenome]
MARTYYQFSKKHFEFELKGITLRNAIHAAELYTEEYRAAGGETWEHIYRLPTRNRAVDIIIYSSVDINTNEVRDHGTDAVRVVMRWTTKKGPVFKALHTHQRITTLFKNLESTIVKAHQEVFSLNYKEFSEAV